MASSGVQSANHANRFLRSVNVEHDHRDGSALQGYLLTAGARRALKRIAVALSSKSSVGAWTLTGPYGTGKSAFCVFASQLLAPPSFPGHAEARAILRRGDQDLFDIVAGVPRACRALWPIVIMGSREPIQVAVLRGLHSSVANYHQKSNPALLRQITRATNEAAAGAPVSDRIIIQLLEQTLSHICSGPHSPCGLFLMIDELGKLLEFAASHPSESDVYVLQHLAEFAARCSHPVLFLSVLHQDFSGYATRLSSLERAEWDKVRGRFEDIIFEEPAEEILRLVAEARTALTTATEPPKRFHDLCRQATKLGLNPPGVSKHEFTDLLARSFPLHPLTAVLLGHVFRKLAQNERSAFSFLTSAEPESLGDFSARQKPDDDFYRLHHLYEYLLHALGDGLYMQRNGKRWAEVESVLDRLPDASPTALAIVKTVGLLNAVGEWRNVAPTADILRFALQGAASDGEIPKAIEYLRSRSAIVCRNYNNSFAIWQGSDIDIDDRVKDARGWLSRSETLASLARTFLSPKPIVARRHLFEKGTLRYFSIDLLHPAEVLDLLGKRPTNADGRIALLLAENPQEEEQAKQLATSEMAVSAQETAFVIPAAQKAFDNALREIAALDWVANNTPQLDGDATARRELRARQSDVRRQLDIILSGIIAPSPASDSKCRWFYSGEELRLASRREFNSLLSAICDKVFHATPAILNELINRKDLSSAAAAGRRNLIEAMLNHAAEPDLGISGTPPEKSMYLSLLMKTGIHRKVDDGFRFTKPHSHAEPGIRTAWGAIHSFLEGCVDGVRPVSELIETLMDRPFGLRAGPAPVLVCAALVSFDSDVALYEDGSFVPQLTTPVFERLMKAPSRFTVRRWKVTGVRATVFHQLAEMLGKSKVVGHVAKRNVLDVVRPILRFAAQLNDYVKHTSRLAPQAIAIREALLAAREADQLLYSDLPKACGLPPITADHTTKSAVAASFLSGLRRGLSDLQRCYDDLILELLQALSTAFSLTGTLPDIRKALTRRAEPLRDFAQDTMLRAFLVRVTDATVGDTGWIESIAALLGERPPQHWRDVDRGTFEVALAKVSRLFAHLEPLTFDPRQNGSPRGIAFRIGITTRTQPEQERVIFLPPESLADISQLEDTLQQAIQKAGSNDRKEITLAAIARLAQRLLT